MKNKLIILQVFIVIVLICTSVYATLSTTISLDKSNETVYQGDVVEVTLSLEDVDSSKAITSVEGYINYDENVLEELTVDSIVKSDDNTVTIGDETLPVEDLTNATVDTMTTSTAYVGFNGSPSSGNGDTKIVIDFKNGITEDVDLLTMKFTVKSNATTGEIEDAISYSMFVITAEDEQSAEITKNVTLTVKTTASSGDSNTNNTTKNNTVNNTTKNNTVNNTTKNNTVNNTTTNNTTNNTTSNNTTNNTNNTTNNTNTNTNNTNTNSSSTNTEDNTVSGTTLPATGAKLVVIPAIILIAIAYISYNKYIKIKDI